MLTLVAAVLLSPIQDFYPLTPGTHLVYEDSEHGIRTEEYVEKVVSLRKDFDATPVRAVIDGRNAGSMFYTTGADTVNLVAYQSPGKDTFDPLVDPQPILRFTGESKCNWTFSGTLASELGPILLSVNGSTKKSGSQKILGESRDTITSTIISKVGTGKAATEVRQEATYAKGIGLIEMKETSKSNGSTTKRLLKLVQFDPPKS